MPAFAPALLAPALFVSVPLAPVAAQEATEASRTVDRLAECRTIAAAADRLACFDALAERIAAARRSGDLLVVDRRQVVERKRRRFGLGDPADQAFDGGEADRATRVTELDTTIRAASPAAAYGRWNLQLADGSVWQTVDTLSFPPKANAPVKLRSATLGGYRATIGGGRTVLVKRLR